MVFGKQPSTKYIAITRQAADGIITYSRTKHPNEAILVLQGENKKDHILIDRLVIPPFSMSGPYYSGFPIHDLPFDLSYLGTAHSHPGGSNKPSLEDLNHFYGIVSLIISHPYEDETLGAFDRNGKELELKILDSWLLRFPSCKIQFYSTLCVVAKNKGLVRHDWKT